MATHDDEARPGTVRSAVERERERVRERDVNKPNRRDSPGLSDTIRRSTNAAVDVFAGVSDAVSRGLRAYNDEITTDNAMRIGLDNGFLEGTLSGYARFFDELSATARRTLDDLRKQREEDQRAQSPAPAPIAVIDYEKLARMVAAELIRTQQAAAAATVVAAAPAAAPEPPKIIPGK